MYDKNLYVHSTKMEEINQINHVHPEVLQSMKIYFFSHLFYSSFKRQLVNMEDLVTAVVFIVILYIFLFILQQIVVSQRRSLTK